MQSNAHDLQEYSTAGIELMDKKHVRPLPPLNIITPLMQHLHFLGIFARRQQADTPSQTKTPYLIFRSSFFIESHKWKHIEANMKEIK